MLPCAYTSHLTFIRYLINCCSLLIVYAADTVSLCKFLHCSFSNFLYGQKSSGFTCFFFSSAFLLFTVSGLVINWLSCLKVPRHECLFALQHLSFPPTHRSRLDFPRLYSCRFVPAFSSACSLFSFSPRGENIMVQFGSNKLFLFTVSMCTRRWHLVIWIVQLYWWV